MARELHEGQSFFKFMLPGFRKKFLIPNTFCALLKREMEISDQAVLYTVKGQWLVRFHRGEDGKFYFVQGWGDFVNHHGLKLGDLATFEHKGGMNFNVDLFDHTACEKEYRRPPCEEFASSIKSIDSRNIITLQHEDPLEAAEAYTSNNPHFILKMCRWHAKSYLNIPREFARSSGLMKSCTEDATNSTLRIPSGKEWPIAIKKAVLNSRNCQLRLVKGWRDFYVSNKLKKDDVCIFELNAGMVLNVVIFAKSN